MGNMSGSYGSHYTLWQSITQNSQDVANNKSNVTVKMYLSFDGSSYYAYTNSSTSGTMMIDGITRNYSVPSINFSSGQAKDILLAEWTGYVNHKEDGTQTLNVTGSWNTDTTRIGSGSCSASKVLSTIPRASSVSGGSGNIGGKTTISVSSASTSFTHTLRYAFGSLSGTIATGVGTSYTWTIPTSFYAQIPSAKFGIGTIYCDTYSGSTLVGTKITSFTATADKETCKPTVSATIKDTNSTTIALTGDANKLIKYKSTAQLVITSTPKNSATIKNVTVNGTNVGTSNSITLNYSNVSTDSFDIIATDTREYPSSTVTISPDYVNYVPLTLNTKIFRPQPTGTEIQMTYSGNYFDGNFGAKQNSVGIEWHYRVKGSSTWIKGGNITPTISENKIVEQTISLGTNFDYQTAYEFYIYAQDYLTSFSTTASVSVGMPVFYWGKDFLRLGSVYHKFEADGSATDNRKISIDTGNYNFNVSSTSGWANGLKFRTNDGSTSLGLVGAYGRENTLEYFFIGEAYDNTDLKVYPNGRVEAGWQFRTDKGGNYISARDNATVRNNSSGQSAGNSFNTVAAQKTTSGCWNIGNLSGEETLKFLYTTDSNYNSGNNSGYYTVTMPRTTGTIQLAPTSLFHNDSGATTVTLSDSAENYNYLEIIYGHDPATHGFSSQKVNAPHAKRVNLSQIEAQGAYIVMYVGECLINAKQITFARGNGLSILGSNLTLGGFSNTNEMKIYKVIGWN